ncbi:hypothetical protein EB73_32475 [Mycobacterium sp. SWH-M3]|nr:hypothetical protein EB73_32475 [Mycobacterium sp. SWH-M3]
MRWLVKPVTTRGAVRDQRDTLLKIIFSKEVSMPGLVNPGGSTRSTAVPKATREHIDNLKTAVRSALGIPDHTTVLVQQLACTEPGCPPVETVVAVLSTPRTVWKLPSATPDLTIAALRRAIEEHPEGHDHADHD